MYAVSVAVVFFPFRCLSLSLIVQTFADATVGRGRVWCLAAGVTRPPGPSPTKRQNGAPIVEQVFWGFHDAVLRGAPNPGFPELPPARRRRGFPIYIRDILGSMF